MQPLFTFEQERYLPTDWARGPWDARFLHGGPTAALLTHALTAQPHDPALLLARVTVDLFRPVPQAPLTVRTELVRQSKRILLRDAFLSDGDTVVARATGLMLRRTESEAPKQPGQARHRLTHHLASWQSLAVWELDARDEGPLFHLGTEFRPAGALHSGQPLAVWMRTPYLLLPDQPLTPVERAAAVSDYVNAVGGMADPGFRSFINADITLHLQREPEGEWLCLESVARPDTAGVATSNVHLYDSVGLLGSVSASCLENPRPLPLTMRLRNP